MKYIIKNCPTYLKFNKCLHNGHCDNINDCLLKRIVDKCKSVKDKGFVMSRYGVKVPACEGWNLACEILELLEIEEVDEK